MADIRHRIGIVGATPAAVYPQLATIDGLRQWWTEDTTGTSEVGGKITFRFGAADRFFDMEVVELTPDEHVAWRCVDGPPEWIDTTFTFDLRAADGETIVVFAHRGWREPVEFMHHCGTKWATYLMSLKHGLESGAARPFPRDEKVSIFD